MSLTQIGPEGIAKRLYRYERMHPALSSPEALDNSHIRHYHEQGFIAIQNVFSPAEVQTYLQAISDLIATGDERIIQFEATGRGRDLTPEQREAYVRKCMWFVEHEARLKAMSEHPKLIAIIERLIGEPVRLMQDMALLKPPHVGREKPWHQDMAYFSVSPPEKIIGTWTALDPATPENGCMHVIPGSHRLGPKPHYHDRDCQLNDEDVNVDLDVMVPLAPGGVLFFSSLIHHGTPPNRSAARRRAVQYHYAAKTCRDITGDEHLKLFYDTLGYAGCRSFDENVRMRPITSRPHNI